MLVKNVLRLGTTLSFVILSITIGDSTGLKFKRRETLQDGVYQVEWETDTDMEEIYFNVIALTKGYVGFGISPNGGMNGADMIIGGIGPDGNPYFSDRHGDGLNAVQDNTENWKLDSISENDTHTVLRFHRAFQTCDHEDLPIEEGTHHLIWSYGGTDDIGHHKARGSKVTLLRSPETESPDLSKFQAIDISGDIPMPSSDTTYWCSLHSLKKFNGTRHISAFAPKFDNPAAKEHTHHFLLYQCNQPKEDEEEIFRNFADTEGAPCSSNAAVRLSRKLCTKVVYVWGVGGEPLVLPENLGLPLQSDGEELFFFLETHCDNPKMKSDVLLKTGVTLYQTENLREFEVGIFSVGRDVIVDLIVPPNASDFVVAGHCSPVCTKKFKTEVKVFAVMLHSHLLGKKIRLRHFRGTTELPWIANDETYDFNYQFTRILTKEVVILPGDQLTLECTYDSTSRNSTTFAGESTKEEMCLAFLLYYPNRPFHPFCYSRLDLTDTLSLLEDLRIQNVSWGADYQLLVDNGDNSSNVSLKDYIHNEVTWTPQLIHNFRHYERYFEQKQSCSYSDKEISYPFLNNTSYQPLISCLNEPPNLALVSSAQKLCFQVTIYLTFTLLLYGFQSKFSMT